MSPLIAFIQTAKDFLTDRPADGHTGGDDRQAEVQRRHTILSHFLAHAPIAEKTRFEKKI